MASGRKRAFVDRFDEVVGRLYEAAIDDEAWPAVLTALGDLSSGIGGHLLIWDRRRNVPIDSFMGDRFPDVNSDYISYYGSIDPRLHLVMNMPVGMTFACHHHFDDTFVSQSEFYNDFLLRNNARFVTGCRLFESGGATAIFGLHRNRRQGPFEAAEMELLERLLPHLKRAIIIRERLRAAEVKWATNRAALDRLTTAVFVISGAGAVLMMNEAARQIIRFGDALVVRHGRLGAKKPAEENRLLGLIREATDAATIHCAGGGPVGLSRDCGGLYVGLVAPLSANHTITGGESVAVLLVSGPTASPRMLSQAMIHLYHFSQAEARLAVLLAQGRTLQDAARERKVGIETIRSQLRSMLEKSGTRRQTDLVKLLMCIPDTHSR